MFLFKDKNEINKKGKCGSHGEPSWIKISMHYPNAWKNEIGLYLGRRTHCYIGMRGMGEE